MSDQKNLSNSDFSPEQEDWTDRLNEIIMDVRQMEAETCDPSTPSEEPGDPPAPTPEAEQTPDDTAGETAGEAAPVDDDYDEEEERAFEAWLNEEDEEEDPALKKKRKKRRIIVTVVLALVLLLGGLGLRTYSQAKQLMAAEQNIKHDVELIIKNGKKLSIKKALTAAQNMDSEICEAKAILDLPTWRMLQHVPKLGQDVAGAAQLLSVAGDATEELLIPTLEKLKTLPLSKLKTPSLKNAGKMADTVTELLNMTEELLPPTKEYMEKILEIPPFRMAELEEKVSQIREICVVAQPMFAVLEEDYIDWLRDDFAPDMCAVISKYPPSKLDTGELSINIRGVSEYLTLLEKSLPRLREAVDTFRQESEQLPAELSQYIEKLAGKVDQVEEVYNAVEKYLPLAKFYLRNDKDYDYLVVAQNSAEIRALGGFPAQACRVTVRKGIMKIRSFTSIYKMLPVDGSPDEEEVRMFGSEMRYNWDAVSNPHFPTVATRWADDYENAGRGELEGVISVTPAILHDFLELIGEVTLLDDVVINSENGLRYLENEIYLKYLKEKDVEQSAYTDKIFADAAVKIMKGVLTDLSLDRLCQCISIFEKHCTDRVIMLWLRDRDGEGYIQALGADGSFNTDTRHPQLGVYFTNIRASKLGWYTDIVPEIGTGKTNADGSITYPITVVIRNTITKDEAKDAGFYVVKDTGGTMKCRLTMVAPAGGSVEDSDGWRKTGVRFYPENYKGSQILVSSRFLLGAEKDITLHFTATTAPGSQAPLSIIATPTLTAYR